LARKAGIEKINVVPIHCTTFYTTAHGVKRIFERGLSLQDLQNVVNYAERRLKQYNGSNGGIVY
jgi:hypothetical protein